MAKRVEPKEEMFSIQPLELGQVRMFVLGTSPLVMNRMSKKAREQLLEPDRTMNRAERARTLKHDPAGEFNESIYRCREDGAPTLVHLPNGAFKKAMAQAAIDIPGATKAQIGRLVKIVNPTVHLYGKPFLYMDVVREGGMTKTPNIRTRAKFPRWACEITVQYVRTLIREQDIVNLMAAAGIIVGVGDGRTEKGTFDNGSWEIVAQADRRWSEIVKEGGRVIQIKAMQQPECIDADSEELLVWHQSEVKRREKEKKSTPTMDTIVSTTKSNGKGRSRRAALPAH
jgi:hypothetical protein